MSSITAHAILFDQCHFLLPAKAPDSQLFLLRG
jgi:hypothetical protein